jgi:hypothetical protein
MHHHPSRRVHGVTDCVHALAEIPLLAILAIRSQSELDGPTGA